MRSYQPGAFRTLPQLCKAIFIALAVAGLIFGGIVVIAENTEVTEFEEVIHNY